MKTIEIYEKAKSGEYLTSKDLSTLIRNALKSKFPKTKFSVRSDNYAGGSSVRISWEDGPTQAAVDAVANVFETRGFDGSIDLAYAKGFWLDPAGNATPAYVEGTRGSMGYHDRQEHEPPGPLAVKVKSTGSYISTSRRRSVSLLQKALEAVKAKNLEPLRAVEWDKIQIVGSPSPYITNCPQLFLDGRFLDSMIYAESSLIAA